MSGAADSDDYEVDHTQKTVFNDCVHGTVTLDPLLVAIIDTPEFQRLRDIKQLGGAYRVYPGAAHNRFEHSIGVSHLAGLFAEKLRRQDPTKVSGKDILCIKVAGLCHDIGHGPFSHLFDRAYKEKVGGQWKHEELSKLIVRRLFDENTRIKSELGKAKLQDSKYLEFICEIIKPSTSSEIYKKKKEEEKQFLFEIVANEQTGLDVDRWDYFTRDCLQLGLGYSFDYLRCMEMAKVINGSICFRDKEAVNIYNMFVTRYNLYRCAYVHKTTMAVELMLAEALYLADDFLSFEATDGTTKRLSEVARVKAGVDEDLSAYCQATDNVYYTILHMKTKNADANPKFKEAKELIKRIEERSFYELIAKTKSFVDASVDSSNASVATTVALTGVFNPEIIKVQIKAHVDELLEDKFSNRKDAFLKADNFIIQIVRMGFGGNKTDHFPLKYFNFFKKESPTITEKLNEDKLPLPIITRSSEDVHIRVYAKQKHDENNDDHRDFRKSLEKICQEATEPSQSERT